MPLRKDLLASCIDANWFMPVQLKGSCTTSALTLESSGTSLANSRYKFTVDKIDQAPARSRGGKMTKQVLKVAAMLILFAGLTAASAAIANGKVSTKRLVVQVPFDFNVGDQTVRAGQYDVILPSNTGGALWVLNH